MKIRRSFSRKINGQKLRSGRIGGKHRRSERQKEEKGEGGEERRREREKEGKREGAIGRRREREE